MSRRLRDRLLRDRRRQRWLTTALRWCHGLPGPLGWGPAGAVRAVNALWSLAITAILRVPPQVGSGPVRHVFVLVLENRSFDHLLGFPLIATAGRDAATGRPTTVDGPDPARDSNSGHAVAPGAPSVMPDDPPHEYAAIRTQLCGPGGDYPKVDMSGFVASYAAVAPADPGLVMRGLTREQVPCLVTLAEEFAVCDRWFSSLPGPTWPNRFFWHAATSGGLDDSPSALRTISSSFVDGFAFENGTIFDRLDDVGAGWAVYHGDLFPQALAISGMDRRLDRFHRLEELAGDLSRPDFAPGYVFIEPSYGEVLPRPTFAGGSSQHPVGDVGAGDRLVKQVYEAIRRSPHWDSSLLIIGHDEHGGFFDHVRPPSAAAPGDRPSEPRLNQHGFGFTQLGARVPAVVVSPLIPRGTVDHGVHDHTSALATVEALYGLAPLTARDAAAPGLLHLLCLESPRADTPVTLPDPPVQGEALPPGGDDEPLSAAQADFLQIALRRHLAVAPAEEHAAIIDQARSIRTQGEAGRYMDGVARRVSAGSPPAGA